MDYRLALMTGVDLPIPECQAVIHQPTLEEIACIGEEDFFVGVQTLSIQKTMFTQDKKALKEITNFQLFMMVMSEKETLDKKHAVEKVTMLLFPECKKMIVTPRSLIFQGENPITIDEGNFGALQSIIGLIFCAKDGPMEVQSFNPGNARAKEIADKLMRGRQRVAEQNGEANKSIFSQYLSILTIGTNSCSINDLKKCTMYQIFDLIERYSLYTNWELDNRVRLAGGKPDSQPDNWMKNIH